MPSKKNCSRSGGAPKKKARRFTIEQLRAAKDALLAAHPNLIEWAMIGITYEAIKVGWQRKGKGRPTLPATIEGVPITAEFVGPARALRAKGGRLVAVIGKGVRGPCAM